MFCSQCGSQNDQSASFCQSCGHRLVSDQTAATIEHKVPLQQVYSKQGTVYVVLGWIFFAISLILVPILFGAGTFIMGFMTYRVRSHVHGVILMVFAVVGALLGSLIGFIIGLGGGL